MSLRQSGKELFRVLKGGKKCFILIGDVRKRGKIIPLAFETMEIFRSLGFEINEIIIKEQFNDRSTAFYARSDFLIVSHEYLFVFEKPLSNK